MKLNTSENWCKQGNSESIIFNLLKISPLRSTKVEWEHFKLWTSSLWYSSNMVLNWNLIRLWNSFAQILKIFRNFKPERVRFFRLCLYHSSLKKLDIHRFWMAARIDDHIWQSNALDAIAQEDISNINDLFINTLTNMGTTSVLER